MNKLVVTIGFAVVLAGGCTKRGATSEPEHPAGDQAAQQQGAGGEHGGGSCPMAVPGTTVAYEDTPDGAAMVFTTRDEVVELQRRVAERAERHNAPTPKRGPEHIPHSARADNIDHGARLVMTPADPNELEALRNHVKAHVEREQKEGCPMGGHGHGGSHD